MSTCSVQGCERQSIARTWCLPHWKRWRRHGDPLGSRRIIPAQERFWPKVKIDPDGCWEWQAGIDPKTGYGKFMVTKALGNTTAHRYSYELNRGPILQGLVVDHLCRNRKCVRPDHLDLCTSEENVKRSPLANHRKTHCPRGHEYTPENIYRSRSKPNGRKCRACAIELEQNRPPRKRTRKQVAA